MSDRWFYVMLHHSLTEDGSTVSWQAIRRWHKGLHPDSPYRSKPMIDIGYHFGIELINDEYEILVGRDLGQAGAHCVGMNHKAIGICFVGNFDLAPVPDGQWEKGLQLVSGLVKSLDIPLVNIVGHRDYAPKGCPGKMFSLEKFRQDLWMKL